MPPVNIHGAAEGASMFDDMKELNLEIIHLGINNENEETARAVQESFCRLLSLPGKDGNKSVFAGSVIECVKKNYLGTHGHIALGTDDIDTAMEVMEKHGYTFDLDTLATDENGVKKAVYLTGEIGGFAIHLLKR